MNFRDIFTREYTIAGSIAILFFLGLRLLFPINSSYDYYTRLSQAFLDGRVCLPENLPWLNELVPIATKGFCVVYPITPALVFVPFVLVSTSFAQTTGAHLFFGMAGAIVYLLFRKRKWSKQHAFLMTLAWCFGTIFWSLSAVGSAWYVAQTIGAVFALLAILIFDEKQDAHIFWAGFFLGLSATARLPYHFYGVYVALLLWNKYKGRWKRLCITIAIFSLGFLPFFSIQRIYNFVRYDTFSDAGYYLIPGKFEEEDFQNGQFNLRNIPKHLRVFLLETPRISPDFPYIVPSFLGMSVLLTSPFLLFALIGLFKNQRYPELITIGLVLTLAMSHGTVGFSQFGYRYAFDMYPLLFLGFDQNVFEKKKQRNLLLFLILFSIVVNFWGVLAFRNDWFIW